MSDDRKNNIFANEVVASAVNTNNDVPFDVAPLPSNGVVYDVNSKLHGKDGLDIKAMTAKEEDILTSRALAKNGTMVSELIRSCLLDKSIDVKTLLSGDRNAIMIAIRISGYGANYEVDITCPECQTKRKSSFDLKNLPILLHYLMI